jgi:hypothetical protein
MVRHTVPLNPMGLCFSVCRLSFESMTMDDHKAAMLHSLRDLETTCCTVLGNPLVED